LTTKEPTCPVGVKINFLQELKEREILNVKWEKECADFIKGINSDLA
jgi:hypothetical protein